MEKSQQQGPLAVVLTLLIISVAINFFALYSGAFSSRSANTKSAPKIELSDDKKLSSTDEQAANKMVASAVVNPMQMSMDKMTTLLDGKKWDDLDKAFILAMVPQAQGGIDLAQYTKDAKHPELQKFGEKIVEARTQEIKQLVERMRAWGYTLEPVQWSQEAKK